MTLFLAIILFLLTSLCGYATWYILSKGGRKKEKKEKEKPDNPKPDSEIKKDSYCYPKINETMGFEFVKVVSVPEELRGIVKEDNKSENTSQPSWENSKAIGSVTTISSEEEDNSSEEPYPEEISNRTFPLHEDNEPEPPGRSLVPEGEEEESEYDNQEEWNEDSLNVETLDAVTGMSTYPWPMSDESEEDGSIPMESIHDMIDQNPDIIDQNETADEEILKDALRAQMVDEKMAIINQMSSLNNTERLDDEARDLMKDLNRNEEEPERNNQSHQSITENDLPDL